MGNIERKRNSVLIFLGIVFGILILNADESYSETLQWTSEFNVGILKTGSSEYGLDLKVLTYEKDSLKIEWQEPFTEDIIVGYQIFRKTLDSDYVLHIENTFSSDTSFVDKNLQKGFYDYKVSPITEKLEPQKISKHGIDRNHSLFDAYLKGQQLLAERLLQNKCPACYEISFYHISHDFLK